MGEQMWPKNGENTMKVAKEMWGENGKQGKKSNSGKSWGNWAEAMEKIGNQWKSVMESLSGMFQSSSAKSGAKSSAKSSDTTSATTSKTGSWAKLASIVKRATSN